VRPTRIVRVATRAIWVNKLRSVLNTFGIIVGVGAIVSVMSIGNGSRETIQEQLDELGRNLIFVRPLETGTLAPNESLTLGDADAIASGAGPNIIGVAPEIRHPVEIRARKQTIASTILGTTPSYHSVRHIGLVEGQFLSSKDLQTEAPVVVLGSSLSVDLFGGISPIGETVFLNERPFQVVGLLGQNDENRRDIQNDIVVAPITTIQARLIPQNAAHPRQPVQSINVQAYSANTVDEAKHQIRRVLLGRHGPLSDDNFIFISQNDLIEEQTEFSDLIAILLAIMAGIALFVGGIGLTTTILGSVKERLREIGLRKAVGAKPRDILNQFLAEALLLSSLGGLIGLGAGLVANNLLEQLSFGGEQVRTLVSVPTMLISLLVAIGIGFVFGLYPAWYAARVEPLEVLRHD